MPLPIYRDGVQDCFKDPNRCRTDPVCVALDHKLSGSQRGLWLEEHIVPLIEYYGWVKTWEETWEEAWDRS